MKVGKHFLLILELFHSSFSKKLSYRSAPHIASTSGRPSGPKYHCNLFHYNHNPQSKLQSVFSILKSPVEYSQTWHSHCSQFAPIKHSNATEIVLIWHKLHIRQAASCSPLHYLQGIQYGPAMWNHQHCLFGFITLLVCSHSGYLLGKEVT